MPGKLQFSFAKKYLKNLCFIHIFPYTVILVKKYFIVNVATVPYILVHCTHYSLCVSCSTQFYMILPNHCHTPHNGFVTEHWIQDHYACISEPVRVTYIRKRHISSSALVTVFIYDVCCLFYMMYHYNIKIFFIMSHHIKYACICDPEWKKCAGLGIEPSLTSSGVVVYPVDHTEWYLLQCVTHIYFWLYKHTLEFVFAYV